MLERAARLQHVSQRTDVLRPDAAAPADQARTGGDPGGHVVGVDTARQNTAAEVDT